MTFMGVDAELGKLVSVAYESVKSKQGFIESLGKLPSVIVHCQMDSEYGKGFLACLQRFHPHLDVRLVKLYSSLGSIDYYVTDDRAFRAFLDGEVDRVRRPEKPQSPKVLAKMVATRLSHARKAVVEVQNALLREEVETANYVEHARSSKADFEAKNPGKEHQWDATLARYEEKAGLLVLAKERFLFPDLRGLDRPALSAWLQDLLKKLDSRYVIRPYVELQNFMLRPDVTEEMLRMACDMVLVGEVMES